MQPYPIPLSSLSCRTLPAPINPEFPHGDRSLTNSVIYPILIRVRSTPASLDDPAPGVLVAPLFLHPHVVLNALEKHLPEPAVVRQVRKMRVAKLRHHPAKALTGRGVCPYVALPPANAQQSSPVGELVEVTDPDTHCAGLTRFREMKQSRELAWVMAVRVVRRCDVPDTVPSSGRVGRSSIH